MKTIAQVAKEIGVSKTAVRNKIANLGLQTSLRKNGNQFAIDEQQELLITRAFLTKSQTENGNQSETQTETVSVLISMLQAELEMKNKQIDDLNNRLAETTAALMVAQKTTNVEQALHAGTIHHKLQSEDDHNFNLSRLSFWSRIFKYRKEK